MDRNDSVLVKFRATEHFIRIRAKTRQRASPWSFDLPRARLADLEAERRIVVKSGYSFAELWLDDAGTTIRIDFAWLSPYGNRALRGFAQTVVLDYGQLSRFVRESLEEDGPRTWSVLYVDPARSQPKLDFREIVDGKPGIRGGLILHRHDRLDTAKHSVHT